MRHFEAQSALDEIVGGHRGCRGLSDRGVLDAIGVRDHFRDGKFDFFGNSKFVPYMSMMARSRQTASLITGVSDGRIVASCLFCEVHPGKNDGLGWDQIKDAESGSFVDPIGQFGESYRDMVARVDVGIGNIIMTWANNSAYIPIVFTHAGPILACYHLQSRRNDSMFFSRAVPLGSIHKMSIKIGERKMFRESVTCSKLSDFQFKIVELEL